MIASREHEKILQYEPIKLRTVFKMTQDYYYYLGPDSSKSFYQIFWIITYKKIQISTAPLCFVSLGEVTDFRSTFGLFIFSDADIFEQDLLSYWRNV